MSKEHPEEPNEAVKLAYVNNAYNTLNAFWGLRSRLALAVGVLSLILLAIALGVVSPEEDRFSFPVAGLALEIPLTGFLLAGAGVITSLVVAFYAVLFRSDCLYLEMIRLYNDLRYVDEAVEDPLKNPFHSVTFYGALRAPRKSKPWRRRKQGSFLSTYDSLAAHSVGPGFVAGLPIVTEFVILGKLATIVEWRQTWIAGYLVVALTAIFLVVTISACVSYHLKHRRLMLVQPVEKVD